MMVAQLIQRNNYFYCSNCRMKQKVTSQCFFCEAIFSNYAELANQLVHEAQGENKDD